MGMPRTAIVPGLSRSRAVGRFGDTEFSPLMPPDDEIDEDNNSGSPGVDGPPPSRPRRARRPRSDRLQPDGPWNDDDEDGDGGGGGGSSSDGSFDIVRPDLISVPQDSP